MLKAGSLTVMLQGGGKIPALTRQILLSSAAVVPHLHLSPAGRTLVYCIPMTIGPDPDHISLIMVMGTGGNLEFSHKISSEY